MIREEAGATPLFFTNVSTILKHFPIINPEEKFNAEDLPAREQKIDINEANNKERNIQSEPQQYDEEKFGNFKFHINLENICFVIYNITYSNFILP